MAERTFEPHDTANLNAEAAQTVSGGPMTATVHNEQSSFREKVLEHLFVADLLRHLWRHGITDAEILTAEVDNAGYDIVIDCNGIIRHIQLKSSHVGATTAQQKVNTRLTTKPSGCVIWLVFDSQTLDFRNFLWFGGAPKMRLPEITGFRTAKHSKANAQGHKAERPNIRIVPKGQFDSISTISELALSLGASKPATHGRFKTSRGVNVQ